MGTESTAERSRRPYQQRRAPSLPSPTGAGNTRCMPSTAWWYRAPAGPHAEAAHTLLSRSPSPAWAKARQLKILQTSCCPDLMTVRLAVQFIWALCLNIVDVIAGEKHHVRVACMSSRSGIPSGRTQSCLADNSAHPLPHSTGRICEQGVQMAHCSAWGLFLVTLLSGRW